MSSTEKIVLTGIKPTGTAHIGNYFILAKDEIILSRQIIF